MCDYDDDDDDVCPLRKERGGIFGVKQDHVGKNRAIVKMPLGLLEWTSKGGRGLETKERG